MEVGHRILLLRNIIYLVLVYNYPIDPTDALKTLNAQSLKYESLTSTSRPRDSFFPIYVQDRELYFIPSRGCNPCFNCTFCSKTT